MNNKESETEGTKLFKAVSTRTFGPDICFLCGIKLNIENRSDEHVIPKWAQDRFNLWNQHLTLLNRTVIPYKSLKVPCCLKCNNEYLQPIESEISEATKRGIKSIKSVDHHNIFLWLGKIFYGILYKELFLNIDRTNPATGPISTPELLQQYEMHHFFIQSSRVPMEFVNFHPASILLFETMEPDGSENQWDFRDGLASLFISCRIGKVGIIAVLQDSGTITESFNNIESYSKGLVFPLHPIQFKELSAEILYKSLLFNRTPKYFINLDDIIRVRQIPLQGMSPKPLYDDWEFGIYAEILADFLQFPVDTIYKGGDRVMSWLRDDNGNLRQISFKQMPFP